MEVQKSRVVLTVHEQQFETEGGIILQSDASLSNPTAEVILLGPECTFVKKGDIVIIPKGMPVNLVYEKQQFVVMNEVDILAKLPK